MAGSRGGERSRTEEDFFTTDNTDTTDKGQIGELGKLFFLFFYPCYPCYPWLNLWVLFSGLSKRKGSRRWRDHAEGDGVGRRGIFFTTDNTDSTDEGADRGTGIFLLLKTTENENGEYPTRRGKE